MSVLSAALPPRLATVSPATGCDCLSASKGGSGSASIIAPTPSDVEGRLCEWTRLLLIRDLRRAQKAHKATSSIRKALAAATLGALQ